MTDGVIGRPPRPPRPVARRWSSRMYAGGLAMLVGGAVLLGIPFISPGASTTPNGNPNSVSFFQGSTGGTAVSGTQPSDTVFNAQLPTGASCSEAGGTGALIYSFLVPEGTQLASLTYNNAPPEADQGTALPPATGGYTAASAPETSPAGLVPTDYLNDLEMSELVATGRGGDARAVQGTQIPGGSALIPAGATSAQV